MDMRNYAAKKRIQLIDRKHRANLKNFPDDEDDDEPNTQ